MRTSEIKIKIKNIEHNIKYYERVYPNSNKIRDLKKKLKYYESLLKRCEKPNK